MVLQRIGVIEAVVFFIKIEQGTKLHLRFMKIVLLKELHRVANLAA